MKTIRNSIRLAALCGLWVSTGFAIDDSSMETLLAAKSKAISRALHDQKIVDEIVRSNRIGKSLTDEQITELDQDWQNTEGMSPFMLLINRNECTSALMSFQEADNSIYEIFVTNERGLNVCQTNKTSDYLQADEVWWQRAYASGNGNEHHGKLEFDDSAGVESIALYIPIMREGKAIGVAKVIVDFTSLRKEVERSARSHSH